LSATSSSSVAVHTWTQKHAFSSQRTVASTGVTDLSYICKYINRERVPNILTVMFWDNVL